jgi:hypothetical protein
MVHIKQGRERVDAIRKKIYIARREMHIRK